MNNEKNIHELEEALKCLPTTYDIIDIITAEKYIYENKDKIDKDLMIHFIEISIKRHFKFKNVQIKAIINKYKKIIQEDNVSKSDQNISALNEIMTVVDSIEISVGQDYCKDKIIYGFNSNGNSYIITSKFEFERLTDIEKKFGLKPNNPVVEISNINSNTIKEFLKGRISPIRLAGLYNLIRKHYSDYMYFDDTRSFDVISIWTMLTYIYKAFRYCPYVWLNSDKGSGKTKLLELAQDLCFNAQMSTNVTPSTVFRYIDSSNATLLIDEFENIMNDKNGDLLTILNSGFQAEGKVSRTVLEDKVYKVKYFSSYSPKALAGINDLPDVLKDRCIRVRLLKKPKDVEIIRYKKDDELLKNIEHIVQGLYVFGLQYCDKIKNIYDSNSIIHPKCLSDRDKDIWEPMFSIAKCIDESVENDLSYKIEDLLKSYAEDKSKERSKSDVEDNLSYRLIRDLNTMIVEEKITPIVKNDLIMYNNEETFKYLNEVCKHNFSTISQLSKILNSKFNIQTERLNIDGQKQRFYEINRKYVEDLMNRYNIATVVDQ